MKNEDLLSPDGANNEQLNVSCQKTIADPDFTVEVVREGDSHSAERPLPEDEHPVSPEESEAARQIAEARKRIAELEALLEERPKDVAALTELMHLCRKVGEMAKCEAAMRTLRDIPSAADIRMLAKEFVAYAKGLVAGESVGMDGLRRDYAPLFEVVDSRSEIRPGDIMDAAGCGCSLAVDVLRALARLGMVSEDLSLGLRKVLDCRNLGQVTVRGDAAASTSGLSPMLLQHYDEALAAVRKAGTCSITVIMRGTGLGYNPAAALYDYINSRGTESLA